MDALSVEDGVELPIATSRRMYAFDGTRPHETAQYAGNVSTRLSIIYFQSARGWKASQTTTDSLVDLGFAPAVTAADAEDFAQRFDLLSRGCGYASWRLREPAESPQLNILD